MCITWSILVHDLFMYLFLTYYGFVMTYYLPLTLNLFSLLLPNLFTTPTLPHYYFMTHLWPSTTCFRFVHNLFMICLLPVTSFFMTCTWLVVHDLYSTCSWFRFQVHWKNSFLTTNFSNSNGYLVGRLGMPELGTAQPHLVIAQLQLSWKLQ